MLRILTVDDHAIVRNGVKVLLENLPGTAAFGEASSAKEAITRVREHEWDVVIMDITLGDRNGLEVMKELKLVRPRLPVLILSMHTVTQYARRAFKAGASGYITKDTLRMNWPRLSPGSRRAATMSARPWLSCWSRMSTAV